MAVNLDRFKKDLELLTDRGKRLHYAMMLNASDASEFTNQVHSQLGKDEAEKFIKKLPNFNKEYESWYSESIALLRQILPDRVSNFISFYEKQKGRKQITTDNYVIQDYLQGLTVKRGYDIIADPKSALPQFRQQLAIVEAANVRFTSALFEIRQLVQADLFDSEIDAARELLKNRFLRAAGAIAGVVLEKHLRQVIDDHSIIISKKNPGIGELNELLKKNEVIDVPQWRHISFLGDIRNRCDHHKEQDPTVDQVRDLIDGAEKVLKTIA